MQPVERGPNARPLLAVRALYKMIDVAVHDRPEGLHELTGRELAPDESEAQERDALASHRRLYGMPFVGEVQVAGRGRPGQSGLLEPRFPGRIESVFALPPKMDERHRREVGRDADAQSRVGNRREAVREHRLGDEARIGPRP